MERSRSTLERIGTYVADVGPLELAHLLLSRPVVRDRSLWWLGLAVAIGILLVAISGSISSAALERSVIDRYRAQHRALAEQATRRLEAYLDAIRLRLVDPARRAASGVDVATTPQELARALRALAGDLSPHHVVFFAHAPVGEVIAVDPAADAQLAAAMLAHDHDAEDGTWHAEPGVCPMCAAHQHALSIAVPRADGLLLAANVQLDHVGADLLRQLGQPGESSLCIRSRRGTAISCHGSTDGDAIALQVASSAHEFSVEAATARSAIVGDVRRHGIGMIVATGAELVALAAIAALVIRRERRRRRDALAAAARLAELDKLATLGTMAAGVMHEIATPLTVARASVEVLQNLTPSEQQEAQRDALDALDRIQGIADDLRRFSRRSAAEPEEFSLRAAVDAAVRLALPTTRTACAVEVDLDPAVRVRANPQHVTQIVLNLVTNAAHAHRRAGVAGAKVMIGVRRVESGRAELVVEDNGPGVPPEHVPKLFSWFFTTKPPGEGTGIGLALSARLASDGGGCLRYESAEPGARFVLDVPLAAAGHHPSRVATPTVAALRST